MIVPDEFEFKVSKQLAENREAISGLITTATGGAENVTTFFNVLEIEDEDTQQSIINKILTSEA